MSIQVDVIDFLVYMIEKCKRDKQIWAAEHYEELLDLIKRQQRSVKQRSVCPQLRKRIKNRLYFLLVNHERDKINDEMTAMAENSGSAEYALLWSKREHIDQVLRCIDGKYKDYFENLQPRKK